MLKARNIGYHIGARQILADVSVEFRTGEFSVILGPNGSGKSTFLKIFSGEIPDFSGSVFYNKRNLKEIKKEDLAKRRAVMSQQPELNFPLMVDEVVMMGRYPHFVFNPSKKDESICDDVIRKLDLHPFTNRNYLTLSGGEKQRVQFARILAQLWEPPIDGYRYLFLDEPIASLDIYYQHQFLQIARELTNANVTVIAVLHDINLAIQYADRILLMKEGRMLKEGAPNEVVTEEIIANVFKVPVKIIEGPVKGKPIVTYHGLP